MGIASYHLHSSIFMDAQFLVFTFLTATQSLCSTTTTKNDDDSIPFHDPWGDHEDLEEKGHLIPDETTLFTFPTITTTAIPRDQDGYPIRSKHFSGSEMKQKLKKFKIIPDVIDESQSPKNPCELMYLKMEPKEKGTHAIFGNKLETAIVRHEPFFIEWPTKFQELYTLLMISPDYPTRKSPTEKEYLHWMVINIPESYVTSGRQMADYVSTIPEPDTGYHRYVVLIFKQNDELRVHRLHSSGDDPSRPHFNTRKFIEEYKLGTPYAINFFESKFTNDSEYWTEAASHTTVTTDTPYPHAGFTWFPKTKPDNETATKEWFED